MSLISPCAMHPALQWAALVPGEWLVSSNLESTPVVQGVPLLLGIVWEARLRRDFLIGRNLPLQHLGRFWQGVLRLSRAQSAPVPYPRRR